MYLPSTPKFFGYNLGNSKKKINSALKRGPKPRLVTDEFLRKVEHLAARGLSQQQVCHALGLSETWWYDAKQKNSEISESFKRGQAKGLG